MSITLLIIAITVITSVIGFNNSEFFEKCLFNPFLISTRKQYYRFISNGFIHDRQNIFHLIFNMYVLYIFGVNVEHYFHAQNPQMWVIYYLALYFGGLIFSALPDYSRYKNDPYYNALGASGAVSAVLFAHILISPTTSLYLMFIPIPIPSFIFGVFYLWVEYYLSKRKIDRVAHWAHISGAIYGLVFTFFTNFALLPLFFGQIINYLKSFFG